MLLNGEVESRDVTEERTDQKEFTIGQIYDDEPAITIGCKKCKGTTFKVGSGNHYTAIKCVTCNWQACIHDG